MKLWVRLPTYPKGFGWFEIKSMWLTQDESRRLYRELGYCTALERAK